MIERGHWCIFCGTVNLYSYHKKKTELSFLKTDQKTSSSKTVIHFWVNTKKYEDIILNRYLHFHLYYNILHNIQDIKATK